jgi:hypothetical protein
VLHRGDAIGHAFADDVVLLRQKVLIPCVRR